MPNHGKDLNAVPYGILIRADQRVWLPQLNRPIAMGEAPMAGAPAQPNKTVSGSKLHSKGSRPETQKHSRQAAPAPSLKVVPHAASQEVAMGLTLDDDG